jgi:hypothetical protein
MRFTACQINQLSRMQRLCRLMRMQFDYAFYALNRHRAGYRMFGHALAARQNETHQFQLRRFE